MTASGKVTVNLKVKRYNPDQDTKPEEYDPKLPESRAIAALRQSVREKERCGLHAADGRRYLDFLGGIAINSLGFADRVRGSGGSMPRSRSARA